MFGPEQVEGADSAETADSVDPLRKRGQMQTKRLIRGACYRLNELDD